jgi:hypothetical protein
MVRGARYYYDPGARVYGGYEVRVRPLANGEFTVLIEPLGMPIEELAASAVGYRRAPMPLLPTATVLREGEGTEINLAVTASGERLFDRIEIYKAAR